MTHRPFLKAYLVLAALVTLFAVLAAQPPDRPRDAPAPPIRGGDPCSTGETPCNPDRPWIRGVQEKSCARPDIIAKMRQEHPGTIIVECDCQHMCNPDDPHAAETDGRTFDARCQARCSPNGCNCPHPCQS